MITKSDAIKSENFDDSEDEVEEIDKVVGKATNEDEGADDKGTDDDFDGQQNQKTASAKTTSTKTRSATETTEPTSTTDDTEDCGVKNNDGYGRTSGGRRRGNGRGNNRGDAVADGVNSLVSAHLATEQTNHAEKDRRDRREDKRECRKEKKASLRMDLMFVFTLSSVSGNNGGPAGAPPFASVLTAGTEDSSGSDSDEEKCKTPHFKKKKGLFESNKSDNEAQKQQEEVHQL